MQAITEQWPGAAEHEGRVPADWMVEDSDRNEYYHFLLYRTPKGELFYTKRKLPGPGWPRFDVREDEDRRAFATPRWRRKPYEAH